MSEKSRQHSSQGHHHHGHHHSHHHESRLKRRLKRWLRKRRWAVLAAVLIIVVIVAVGLWMRRDMKSRSGLEVKAARQVDMAGGYRSIEYNGKTYRYNNRVTSILYAGIDSEDDIQAKSAFTAAPRADSVSLVVMDELNNRMTIIALNRDTMTDIHKYTVDGKDRGAFTDHLAFAYTYGDGGKVSCQNLCRAVSDLLFGIPIDGYVVSNRASLPLIGEAIGPVEVVVPNSDLEEEGFIQGTTAIIDSDNLMTFVRTRDTGTDLSNVSRMERQQAYINAAIDKIVTLLTKDSDTAWRFMEQAEACILTDISRNRYLDLTRVLKNTYYTDDSYYTPEGEQVVGARHDEFYPDMDALHEKVIELFYMEN
jgi:anionic cell wall polymer biosynthesis LytR-Cps2A-Psr (LCP) family protein